MAGKSRHRMLLCLCSVGLAFSSQGTVAQSDNSFKIRAEVELAMVQVAVMDKEGNPVRNLKKEDFELYEDGKKQEILSIDEVNSESGISSLGMNPIAENALHGGKIVLIIFDDSAIQPQYIKASRDSARKFVDEHMRPQDRFAIAAYGMSMRILQNFTGDREKVMRAIEQAEGINAGGGAMYFENLLRALDGINHTIAMIKGQKSILIFSQSGSPDAIWEELKVRPVFQVPLGSLETTFNRILASTRKSNASFHIIDTAELNTLSLGGLSLGGLAAASGGSVIGTHMDAGLELLDKQISNYYVLSFQSNNPKHDTAFRKLEVRTKLKGVALKHQAGYQDRRPVDILASTREERTLLTAFASPGVTAQLPVVFRAAYFYDPPRAARVLVAARIRMEKATFREKEGQLQTDLSIMGVAYAEDGSIAARFSQTLPVSFDEKRESDIRREGLKLRNYFKLRPGKYRLKLAVSDDSGNIGSMEQFLEVPALPDRELASSSIVIAEQASHLPDLIRNLQSQLLDESDPLLCRGFEIEPSAENKLPTGSVVPLMFRVYNLSGPSDQWDLKAKARLLAENAREYILGPISLKKAVSPLGNGEAVVILGFSFQDAPPGRYRLIIETTEPAASGIATAQTDLEFTASDRGAKAGQMRDSSQGLASVDAKNKTVIGMSEKELRRNYRNQIRSLKFDANQESLETLMKRVGDNVLAFLRNLSNTASKEQIKMNMKPKYAIYSGFRDRVEEFQYLILPNSGGPGVSWVEERTDKKNRRVDLLKKFPGFMISSGYAMYCLYLDPRHQKNADFRYLGRETGKQRNHVIAFAQKSESGDYLSYYYNGSLSSTIRFLVQGFIWVNPDTYQISRIYTSMLSMETPSSLKATTADVVYQKITFGDDPREFWLPRDVQVEWEFPDRTYTTRHRYSDYHLFTVETDYKIAPVR
jgi:VWFA-related protein